MNQKLLKVKDVGELLGLTEETIRAKARRREIPHVKLGGAIRFEPDQIQKYIEGCRCEPK